MADQVKAPEVAATAPVAKKQRVQLPSIFPTAEAAVKEAEGRTKGPRRAFCCKHGQKTLYVVAHNEGRAGGVAFMEVGGQVEELGKAKKAKALGVDGILAAVNSLPEDQRAAVLAQLKSLAGGKK